MSKVDVKKRLVIQRVADYLLEKGLNDTAIRSLAKASGTSDRMLIYYFGSKDELLNQTLGAIAAGVTGQLDAALGTHVRSQDVLLGELTAVTHHPSFEPSIKLWFELVGLAARGKEPYLSNAELLGTNWINWIASRLENPGEGDARDLYAHLEGRVMLKMINV